MVSRAVAITLVAWLAGCAAPTLKPRSPACTLAVLVAPTAGCESTPLAEQALDDEAKRFAAVAGTAQIYVSRASFVGARELWGVGIDGVVVGVLSLDTYLMVAVEPGPHRVTVITAESQHMLEVSAADGDNLFLEATPKMGFAHARAQLRVLSPESGRKRVLQERRVLNPSASPAGRGRLL